MQMSKKLSNAKPESCLCESCTCTGCKEECYGHCRSCDSPTYACDSYQTEGSKRNGKRPPSPEELAEAERMLDDPAQSAPEALLPDAAPPAFDTTGLDLQTVVDLELAEREYRGGLRMAERGLWRMADAVAIAHEAFSTCATKCRIGETGQFDKQEVNFGAWCGYMGINRKAAERLLQVSKLLDNSTPKQQKLLEELAPSLLYAAASPSAPAQLVEGVKNGDITTHKQYKELEAKYKAAQQENADKDKKLQQVEDNRKTLEKQLNTAEDERAAAAERADYFKQRAEAAESRPVEVVGASPEDIARWKAEGEKTASDRLAAEMAAAVSAGQARASAAAAEAAKIKKQLASARRYAENTTHRADVLAAQLRDVKAQLQTEKDKSAGADALAAQLADAQQQIAGLQAQLRQPQAPPAPSPPPDDMPEVIPCNRCALYTWCLGLQFDDGVQDFLNDPDAEDTLYDRLSGCTAGVWEKPAPAAVDREQQDPV